MEKRETQKVRKNGVTFKDTFDFTPKETPTQTGRELTKTKLEKSLKYQQTEFTF